MPKLRRAFVEGASYFFTVVTFVRLPVLTTEPLIHRKNLISLRQAQVQR